jgi:hypothetical protein
MAAEPTAYPAPEHTRTGLDRLTWAVVVSVVLLVLAGIGAVVLTTARQAPPDLSTPGGVAVVFEQDIDRGDTDQAWGLLSSAAQATTSQQNFQLRAGGFRNGGGARYEVQNVRIDGDMAHLDLLVTRGSRTGFLVFGSSTFTSTSPVTLQRENGQWRVSVPAEPYLVSPRPG